MGMGTPDEPIDSAREWNEGACDIMAVALHRIYGLPMMAEFEWGLDDDGKEQLGYLTHAWVRLPDGRALDAEGPREMFNPTKGGDLNDEWVKGYRIVEIADDDPHLLDTREEDDYRESIRVSGATSWLMANLHPELTALGLQVQDVWGTLTAVDEEADDRASFQAWRVASSEDGRNPLLVIVHPGDAIETDAGNQQIRREAARCQENMAAEIGRLSNGGWDCVVLHRSSCAQYAPGKAQKSVAEQMRREIQALHATGTVLYGDDLGAAGNWMEDHLDLESRPAIRLTGAYADPLHGCVTAIGEGIQAYLAEIGGRATVSLSEHAYAGPGGTERWQPQAAASLGPRLR